MDHINWHTVTSIVDEALDLPKSERTDFIRSVCRDDSQMIEEVERFLDSIDRSEGLWENLLQSNRVLVDDFTQSGADTTFRDEKMPHQIGPHKIIDLIASGGMGHVYLAERNDGHFSRKVAIKVLRNELNSDSNIDRFYQERTILSTLEHPNIARLYDGGMTDDGRPYLVMEYVDGMPIHRYVQQNALKLSAILSLFEQICEAVRYAHNHFVIHRDLKPYNIFVTSQGIVKVLYFGVAKIVDPANSESSVSQHEKSELILSLLYAAPEQIQKGKITASTDVYMLGLILYELLTSTQPFADAKIVSFAEASDMITGYVPPLPSESVEQKDLQKKLKGDLDAVICKAIRKNPADRYQSADFFISDLENYKSSRPVSASKATLPYRLRKFVNRNRQLAGSASLFIIAAACFLAYHISSLTEQRNIAQLEAQKSQMVTSFMTDIFSSADPVQNIEDTLNVYQLLDRGRDRILHLEDQPQLQADLLLAMSQSYLNLGGYEQSEALLQIADSIALASLTDDALRQTKIANKLGHYYDGVRNYEHAITFFDRAYSQIDRLPRHEWRLLSSTYHGMGKSLTGMGEAAEGERWLRSAIEFYQQHGEKAKNFRSVTLSLARNLRVQNNYAEAESIYLEIMDGLSDEDPDDFYTLFTTLNNLGYLNRVLDRYEPAVDYYSRAFNIGSRIYPAEHPVMFMLMNNLASALSLLGRYEEARQFLVQKEELAMKRYGKHWRTGRAIGSVGRLHFQLKEFDRAAEKLLESENIFREVLGNDHYWTDMENLYRNISLKNAGRFDQSLTTLPAFQAMLRNRDTFTAQDSASMSYLIEQTEEYSVADMNEDLQELKALLNR